MELIDLLLLLSSLYIHVMSPNCQNHIYNLYYLVKKIRLGAICHHHCRTKYLREEGEISTSF